MLRVIHSCIKLRCTKHRFVLRHWLNIHIFSLFLNIWTLRLASKIFNSLSYFFISGTIFSLLNIVWRKWSLLIPFSTSYTHTILFVSKNRTNKVSSRLSFHISKTSDVVHTHIRYIVITFKLIS
nr:MAG TPA: hypothetical protein [Caudoviricetes sp.]